MTNTTLEAYAQEFDALAKTQRYQAVVKALIFYKCIKKLFALTLATEIGDIKRFPHPRQLVAWIGMDI
ncbi:MAG: transposase [Pseudomonadales bacterium]|nr:transposase [Pseudomonadales bacterium]